MNQLSDEELITLCASGDRCGMDELVSRYHGKLLELALRHLADREASADIAQVTLLRVFQHAKSFRQKSSFRTWLYAIALNLIRDYMRKSKRRSESLLSEIADDDQPQPELVPNDESAEDAALQKIESSMIWRCVTNLPPQHRSAVILKFRMGLTYDEISEIMGAPSGTVKSWIHYALKKLKISLECEGLK